MFSVGAIVLEQDLIPKTVPFSLMYLHCLLSEHLFMHDDQRRMLIDSKPLSMCLCNFLNISVETL